MTEGIQLIEINNEIEKKREETINDVHTSLRGIDYGIGY